MLSGVLPVEEQSPLVNGGKVWLRRTHPNLYRMVTFIAVVNVLLALNFFLLNPTFLLWHAPNEIWGAIFFALGVAKLTFLNAWRSIAATRACLAFAVSYFVFVAIGACEPWYLGVGSLQLPILYLAIAAVQVPLLFEPFINPLTAKSS